jgi:TonB family protein
MEQKLNKIFLLIILVLIEIGCSSNQSISRKDSSYAGLRRTILLQVGSSGNVSPTHVVLFWTDLFSDMSFLVVAQDTTKPSLISFMIAAKDPSTIGRIALIDSAGNAINLSETRPSRFQWPIWKYSIVASTDLTWDKFEELCRIDSIRFETERLRMFLGKSIMHDLNLLHNYLIERDPNEPPSDNPTDDEVDPKVLERVEPIYPELALRAGLEGDVVVKVWIDKKGNARKVVLLQTSSEIFNEPSIEAAYKWKFTPAKILGKTISVWVSIPFRFRVLPKE